MTTGTPSGHIHIFRSSDPLLEGLVDTTVSKYRSYALNNWRVQLTGVRAMLLFHDCDVKPVCVRTITRFRLRK